MFIITPSPSLITISPSLITFDYFLWLANHLLYKFIACNWQVPLLERAGYAWVTMFHHAFRIILEYSPLTVWSIMASINPTEMFSVPNQPLHYQHVSSLFSERVHVSIFIFWGHGGKMTYFLGGFFSKFFNFFKFDYIVYKYFPVQTIIVID